MGLKDSYWATKNRSTHVHRDWTPQSQTSTPPPEPRNSPAAVPATTAADAAYVLTTPPPSASARELDRFLKLVARLKWKLPFLAEGYRMATDRASRPIEEVDATEMHFKIDFYEYYMHIERALVHLMGVFGVKVTGLGDSMHNPSNKTETTTTPSGLTGARVPVVAARSSHRYHANVLAALERPDNPLHEVLGRGDFIRQLSRAKELRNRWKNADEYAEDRGYTPAPLEAYNLETILETIFAGFERGHALADAYVRSMRAESGLGSGDGGPGSVDLSMEEDDWGFIADAMDWEAV